MHPTMFRGRLSDAEIVANFLALPPEAMPSATWVDDGPEFSGSCWPHLRDFLLPMSKQRLNHTGDGIRLHADRDQWRDGVIVNAG